MNFPLIDIHIFPPKGAHDFIKILTKLHREKEHAHGIRWNRLNDRLQENFLNRFGEELVIQTLHSLPPKKEG